MEKKIKAGQKVYENLSKSPEKIEAGDLLNSMTKDWPEKITNQYIKDKEYCLKHGYDYSFIHIFLSKPKLLPGAIDVRFISRLTAPQMTPSSILYRCNYKNEEVEFMWALPDEDIIKDALKHPNALEYQDIMKYCVAYTKGSWVKKTNTPTSCATNN